MGALPQGRSNQSYANQVVETADRPARSMDSVVLCAEVKPDHAPPPEPKDMLPALRRAIALPA